LVVPSAQPLPTAIWLAGSAITRAVYLRAQAPRRTSKIRSADGRGWFGRTAFGIQSHSITIFANQQSSKPVPRGVPARFEAELRCLTICSGSPSGKLSDLPLIWLKVLVDIDLRYAHIARPIIRTDDAHAIHRDIVDAIVGRFQIIRPRNSCVGIADYL
jgi:hypothetical protein